MYLREVEHCLAAGLEPKRIKKRDIWTHWNKSPKVHPMPVFSRLPSKLEREIFLVAAAEHANPHCYLLIARRVLDWWVLHGPLLWSWWVWLGWNTSFTARSSFAVMRQPNASLLHWSTTNCLLSLQLEHSIWGWQYKTTMLQKSWTSVKALQILLYVLSAITYSPRTPSLNHWRLSLWLPCQRTYQPSSRSAFVPAQLTGCPPHHPSAPQQYLGLLAGYPYWAPKVDPTYASLSSLDHDSVRY